ncbi:MAG: polysaccharide deacetylase family protein [Treponema sp.]|jgi:peptidoglycan/xylan/chitin deacetylase (PgdA/CDA1 family)|nr:polysaccharide deacetylase family protein [Treponema sp.]
MKHNPYVLFFLFLVLVMPVCGVWGKVIFSGLNLSGDNRMLFRADSDANGSNRQDALFVTRLTDLALQQMTAFPEKMDLVENGRILQIRNAFGAVRIPVSGGLPQTIPGFPAFADGAPVFGGRIEGIAVSGDGRWLLYVEPVTAAYGNLILINTETGGRIQVSANVERPDTSFPACWSPDSRVFVYCRGNRLYYHNVNVNATFSVDERYRVIGEGTISSVYWTEGGDFFYLRGSTVYRVRGPELFARTVYADFLEIGSPAGKIPYEFDYNFDAFWISPDSRAMLLSKGGQNIFYYPLGTDGYGAGGASTFPYIMLPRSGHSVSVLWSAQGQITVLVPVSGKDGVSVAAYRLGPQSGGGLVFRTLDPPAGAGGALSPDGTRAVFWGERGVILYDYANWRPLSTLSTRPAYSCLWLGSQELVTGDGSRIERIRLLDPSAASLQKELICVSSANDFGFEERGERILARAGGIWYVTDGRSPWAEASNPALRPVAVTSGRYRVYLERQVSGPYENIPMIRNTVSVGTSPLLPGGGFPPSYPDDGPIHAEEPLRPGDPFTHSRRQGLREAAVCFDLYDDIAGLPGVLETLRRFGIRATFFLNGEFIRRHPAAVRDIVEAGHETASMFFALIDLSDSRYRIQSDFISRGLARNEDEFFNTTGNELSLIWHAPYYTASAEIVSAAAQAGYTTAGRDVDPMDWVSREDVRRGGVTQYSASDMIDRIMEQKRPGSIIPIRLGVLAGGRSDYLYTRLGVLLDALIREGYSLTPVSTLIEHAR